jgi:hypothetical protein
MVLTGTNAPEAKTSGARIGIDAAWGRLWVAHGQLDDCEHP